MKRKYFETGFREMMKQSGMNHGFKPTNPTVLKEVNTNVDGVRRCSVSTTVKIGANLCNGRSEYLRQVCGALGDEEIEDIEIVVKIEDEGLDCSSNSILGLLGYEAPGGENQGLSCDECGKTFTNQKCLDIHCSVEHLNDDEEEEEGINFGNKKQVKASEAAPKKKPVEKPAVEGRKPPIKVVMKSKKKQRVAKTAITLREQQLDNERKFKDNAEKKDGGFTCKICRKFSSITELLVQAHIISCSKRSKRKKGQPMKKSTCLECGKEFPSKKDLKIHHKREHICEVYTCSTCLKQFAHRPAYVRHIQSHSKFRPKLVCSVLGCEKGFRFACDLKRHLASHLKSNQLVEKVRWFHLYSFYFFSEISFLTFLVEERILLSDFVKLGESFF
jgi:hypothetical protein